MIFFCLHPSDITRHLHAAASVGGLGSHICPSSGRLILISALGKQQLSHLIYLFRSFVCLHAADLTVTCHPPVNTCVCMSLLVCACRCLSAVVNSANVNAHFCLFLSMQLTWPAPCRCHRSPSRPRLCLPQQALRRLPTLISRNFVSIRVIIADLVIMAGVI